jgi:hypothetical protein
MRISVLVSIAIALTVVAGQAAIADPEARNHGNKPSDNPLSDVAKLQRKYLADDWRRAQRPGETDQGSTGPAAATRSAPLAPKPSARSC